MASNSPVSPPMPFFNQVHVLLQKRFADLGIKPVIPFSDFQQVGIVHDFTYDPPDSDLIDRRDDVGHVAEIIDDRGGT